MSNEVPNKARRQFVGTVELGMAVGASHHKEKR